MRKTIFIRLKEIDKEIDMNNLEIGDYFLYGKNLIGQKQNKEIGQPITYYEIISKSYGSVEYIPIYDYMEEDKGE